MFIVLDYAAIHHVHEVPQMINRAGAILRYLPPYSPDLNPIEQAFESCKKFIRANDFVYLRTRQQRPMIMESFLHITNELCQSYFQHCGYVEN